MCTNTRVDSHARTLTGSRSPGHVCTLRLWGRRKRKVLISKQTSTDVSFKISLSLLLSASVSACLSVSVCLSLYLQLIIMGILRTP